MITSLTYDESTDTWVDDNPSFDDEPPYGSFPEEMGETDLIGTPYSQAMEELAARYDSLPDPFDTSVDDWSEDYWR